MGEQFKSRFLERVARKLELIPAIAHNEQAQAVHHAQASSLFEAGKTSIIANLLVAIGILVVTWGYVPGLYLLVWFGFLTFVVISRQIFIVKTLNNPRLLESPKAIPLYVIGTLYTAIAWAIVPMTLFPENVSIQAFQGFCLAGLAAGGSTTLATVRGAMLSFTVPILFPLFLQLVATGDQTQTTMGLLTLCFFVFLTKSASFSRQNFIRLVNMRLEKDFLTRELAEALTDVQQASALKSSLLANVSHEIRTPMNAIIGMTEEALQQARSAEVIECLETSLDSSKWLLQIVNDLLDISKIEAGKLKIANDPFHLRREIVRITKLIQPKIAEKRLQLVTDIKHDVPDSVSGDALRFGQVLLNLLGNAVKFTPEGGTLTITISLEDLNTETCRIRTSVSDTGIGISVFEQERIFEAFTQADSSITRRFGGTGLGLAISSELCKLMDGKIWLESEENKGSTFHYAITFDVVEETSADAVSYTQDIEQIPELSLLVVDDNAINQKVVGKILSRFGHRVVFASDGREALDKIAEQEFSIVFMDCQMPVMDGLTASMEIRKREEDNNLKRVPIIALTAHAHEEDRRRCLESGMDAFLTKPIDKKLLIQTLYEQYSQSVGRNEETQDKA